MLFNKGQFVSKCRLYLCCVIEDTTSTICQTQRVNQASPLPSEVRVCVPQNKPSFLTVDTQHTQCPCRFLTLARCKLCGHRTTTQREIPGTNSLPGTHDALRSGLSRRHERLRSSVGSYPRRFLATEIADGFWSCFLLLSNCLRGRTPRRFQLHKAFRNERALCASLLYRT